MALIQLTINIGLQDQGWILARDRCYIWCKENCEDYFALDMFSTSMLWSFENEIEAMAFKLRWC